MGGAFYDESRFLEGLERIARAFERIADNLDQVTETPVGQVRALNIRARMVDGAALNEEGAGVAVMETPS